MTSLPPNRDDGWRMGGAQAARLEIWRQRKVECWRHAYEIWLSASVLAGLGGFVNGELAQSVNDAIWEACNAQSAWEEALQEHSPE